MVPARRRHLTLTLAVAGLALAAGRPARTQAPDACPADPPRSSAARVPDARVLVFPLPTAAATCGQFGEPRGSGRTHEGMDLTAPKLTPVRAVASGTVDWLRDEQGGRCCDVGIAHDDGWSSRYIHLNNDTPGTDDGQGRGIAEGITMGSRVEAGQVIGWVGDSGNAEEVGPHLHFELRDPSGRAIDPRDELTAAAPPATPDSDAPLG